MSRFSLEGEGKVALITGGASGIGRTVAEVFGEAGYRLLLLDIDARVGEQAAIELGAAGREVEFIACDVAREAQVAVAIQSGLQRWGRLDFLMNNAGIVGRGTPIDKLDEADLDRVFGVDLKAAFFTCKHVVPVMREQGGGSILNVASITARTGSAYYTAYAAAKAGVVALTRGLARNIGRFNIRINCLNPGSVGGTGLMRDHYQNRPEARQRDTLALMRKIPLGRSGRPHDVAHFALFLASSLAAHIHGAVLTIDGGESLGYQ
jgi:NAD(P)-dependent dehydrogenase (short-subunit alcohol dehydrogenase family)